MFPSFSNFVFRKAKTLPPQNWFLICWRLPDRMRLPGRNSTLFLAAALPPLLNSKPSAPLNPTETSQLPDGALSLKLFPGQPRSEPGGARGRSCCQGGTRGPYRGTGRTHGELRSPGRATAPGREPPPAPPAASKGSRSEAGLGRGACDGASGGQPGVCPPEAEGRLAGVRGQARGPDPAESGPSVPPSPRKTAHRAAPAQGDCISEPKIEMQVVKRKKKDNFHL